MTIEEYIAKFKDLDDSLNELWKKNYFKEHYKLFQEERKLLDQMDADPDLTAEDRIYITYSMINYGRKNKEIL